MSVRGVNRLVELQTSSTPASKEVTPAREWATGTSSATLAMMIATARQKSVPEPALEPGAVLLTRKIAPLSGECGACDAISVVSVKASSVGVAWRYATCVTKEQAINIDREKLWQKIDELILRSVSLESFFTFLSVNIFRILELGLDTKGKEELKNYLIKSKNGSPFSKCPGFDERMALILESFDQVQKIEFNAEEWDLIEHPCPVVFKIQTQEKARNTGSEHQLKGPLRLGKEIIEIQTFPEAGAKRIQKVLTGLQVEVTVPTKIPTENLCSWNDDSDNDE